MTNEQMSESRESRGFVWFAEGLPLEMVTKRVEAASETRTPYWLCYRADRPYFEYRNLEDLEQQIAIWPEGRVFGEKLEIRWERRGGGYAVWVLSEEQRFNQELEEAGFQEVAGPWTVIEHERAPLFLWGTYNTRQEGWVEVKVPNTQHYPIKPPEESEPDTEKLFARLQAVYYQADNGAVHFTRLKGVQ
jgi:hypothetical protein